MNSIVQPGAAAGFNGLDRFLRTRLLGQLAGLRGGCLLLVDPLGESSLGEGVAGTVVTTWWVALISGARVGKGVRDAAGAPVEHAQTRTTADVASAPSSRRA